ncbi:MAG: hypothetical protein V1905_01900 [bacterium]
MYNWSVDTSRLKRNKDAWNKWKLEQMINFGLAGEKLSRQLLIKYWDKLELDPQKKEFLRFLLWKKT